jgi:hypothetical protein
MYFLWPVCLCRWALSITMGKAAWQRFWLSGGLQSVFVWYSEI